MQIDKYCYLCCEPEPFICAYIRITCSVSVFVYFLCFDLLMVNVGVNNVFLYRKCSFTTKVYAIQLS